MTTANAAHGIYVHVPWCRAVCPYCAFYVVRDDGIQPTDRYVDRVLAEHARWASSFPGPVRSVFLGGGTPSRLPLSDLRRLLAGLPPAPEVGVEVNPEDVDARWVAEAIDLGVTRISVGVQSFSSNQARRLGRGHTVAEAHRVLNLLRDRAPSWSLDLIFAVPDQTLTEWDRELDVAIDAGAPHISLYGLTWEPGTPLDALRVRGRLKPVDDDLWRDMYDRAVGRLAAAGLNRYEVSNFARHGHRSVHNEGYWAGRPYMGLGPSAHGFAPDGRRWTNPRDLSAWLAGAPEVIEHPTGTSATADLLLAGLRRVDGIDLDRLRARTGHAPSDDAVRALVRGGMLRQEGPVIALTDAGFPVADAVVLKLVDTLP